MSGRIPEYAVFEIDMSAAGSQRIDWEADAMVFLSAEDKTSGALNLDAKINVQLGVTKDDEIPLQINSRVLGRVIKYRFSWAAQANTVAKIMFSRLDRKVEGIEVLAPPAKQLVTSAAGTSIEVGEKTIGAVEVLIAAANAGRQSLMIKNAGAQTVFIGPSGVLTTTGYPLDVGESLTLEGQTGAVYGIAAAAGNTVRHLEEA